MFINLINRSNSCHLNYNTIKFNIVCVVVILKIQYKGDRKLGYSYYYSNAFKTLRQ